MNSSDQGKGPVDPVEFEKWIFSRLEISSQNSPPPPETLRTRVLAKLDVRSIAAPASILESIRDWLIPLKWVLFPLAAGAATYGLYQIPEVKRWIHELQTSPTERQQQKGHNSPVEQNTRPAASPSAQSTRAPDPASSPAPLNSAGPLGEISSLGTTAFESGSQAGLKDKNKPTEKTKNPKPLTQNEKTGQPKSDTDPNQDEPPSLTLKWTGRLSWTTSAPNQFSILLQVPTGTPKLEYQLERKLNSEQDFSVVATLKENRMSFDDHLLDPHGQQYRVRAFQNGQVSEYSSAMDVTPGVPEAPRDVFALPFSETTTNDPAIQGHRRLVIGWGIPAETKKFASQFIIRTTYPSGESHTYPVSKDSDRMTILYKDMTLPVRIEIQAIGLSGTSVSSTPYFYCPGKLTPGDVVNGQDYSLADAASKTGVTLPHLTLVDPIDSLRAASQINRANLDGDRKISHDEAETIKDLSNKHQRCPF